MSDSGSNGPMHDNPSYEPEDRTPNGDARDANDIELEDKDDKKKKLDRAREKLHFDGDQSMRIDYVLAYTDTNEDKTRKRQTFEKNLEANGLILEYEKKEESQDGKTYVKLSITWDALTTGAELLFMEKRIKMPKNLEDEMQGCCDSCCGSPLEVGEPIIQEEPDYFTAEFNRSNIAMFDIPSKDTFFTNAERSIVTKEILDRTTYTGPDEKSRKFGISRLLRNGIYTAAYPLHEGRYKPRANDNDWFYSADRDRQRLYEAWARPGRWYCYQPLDLIRKYFGEKIAIYFAWLGFYTSMLIPATIVGVAVFVYGIATVFQSEPSNEICDKDKGGDFIMCPTCDERCGYSRLGDSCLYSRLSYVFDNPGTVVFACFMAIWATFFLEFWKRKQKEIEYDWDVADFEMEERMRPEYEYTVTHSTINPVTGEEEPYLPWYSRFPRSCTSFTVLLLMMCLVIAAIFGVVIYRIIMIAVFYNIEPQETVASLATSLTASVINLILIMILSIIYKKVAEFLTNLEMPRTFTEFEDSFTFKMFLFQFVNFYGTVFYIAFFKGKFNERPGTTENYVFGKYRQDECDPSGCVVDLAIQLGVVMVGKQFVNNAKELLLPVFCTLIKSRKSKKEESEDNLYMRWEQDKDLSVLPDLGLFDKYLEMVIQYGFVTIFVAAFPLAPFFALLNNVIEIRLDAYKFVTAYRRPPALRAQDIGVWYGILQGLTFLAVVSNAFIIAWTSSFIPQVVYAFQHNPDGRNLKNFMNFSLSYFDVNDYAEGTAPDDDKITDEYKDIKYCRFKGFLESPETNPDHKYEYSTIYWHVFAARLAFIIAFEHATFLLTWFVSYIIPDVPAAVSQLQLYENALIKKLRFDAAFHTKAGEADQNTYSAFSMAEENDMGEDPEDDDY